MTFLRLAFKSIRNRALATCLTVLSIAMSVALFLSVETLRAGAENGFTSSISQVDLIVGARSGSLQMLLASVFNIGNVTHNISWETYQKWQQDPAMEWTIPISIGDGHRGFRVVGTDQNFFSHYHFHGDASVEFAEGQPMTELWDAVVGADVAETLNYHLGQAVVISHGGTQGDSFQNHSDKPFRVSGILKPTGTPIDRTVFISLQGDEALHLEVGEGLDHSPSLRNNPSQWRNEEIPVKDLTVFYARSKSRVQTLALQRKINEDKGEALLAIIPGVALQDLWQALGYIGGLLRAVSILVVLVGFASMVIALTSALNERRREMAILRSLGASQGRILSLLVLESALLTGAGIFLGVVIFEIALLVAKPWFQKKFSLFLSGLGLEGGSMAILALIFMTGILVGFIPALRALRQSLKDGLSVQN